MKHLARLGSVTFSLSRRSYKTLCHRYQFKFGEQKTLNNGTVYHAIGATEQEIDLDGELIMSGNLDDLIVQSETKTPHLLTLGHGETIGKYLVTGVTMNKRDFFSDGLHRRCAFSIKLKQYHGDEVS